MKREVTLPAVVDSIRIVTEFVDEQLEELGCPIKAQMQIDVAIDELFSNIAYYAYPDGQGEATVCFSFAEGSRLVSITFTDTGTPFNPLESKEPDTTAPASEREIGGLGILLVRKTMDDVSYRFEDGQNQLTICKRI